MRDARRLVAEFTGTALLLATIVGSGIMGDRLFAGQYGSALLVNSLATGAVLAGLIAALSGWSAHFNPAVSVVEMVGTPGERSRLRWWILAQLVGAGLGVIVANVMFGEPPVEISGRERVGLPLLLSEAVATFGLLLVIRGCAARRPSAMPAAVGAYVAGAIWFTSSTAFANPAVTVGRALTNTFTGIRPVDVPAFVAAQLVGAALAGWVTGWLAKEEAR
ncbi:MAG: aquaporin family protein [Deltaproteobacteria bacterium]|nr:aquaporin family protein [Deltaproteobacteria bacterium]